MRNLHIDASRLRSGGGIVHLIKLLEYSDYSDYERIIVYTYNNSSFINYVNDKIIIKTHSFINKSIFYQILWQSCILKREISKDDVLFTIDSTSFCYCPNNVVLNQDIIGFQENSFKHFTLKNKILSYVKYVVAKVALKKAKTRIFTTQFAADEVTKKIPGIGNSFVVPHGIDDVGIVRKNSYATEDGLLKLIYVSPILDYKNHSNLVKAIEKLCTNDQKIITYFVGGGDQQLIEEIKKTSSYIRNAEFHFINFIDREAVFRLTASCDIAVFLSSIECFGITLLEYMRIGMPIICSNASSMPETFEDGGVLVNPLDENAIASAISYLNENSDYRAKYGAAARKISEKYSWQATAKNTFDILNAQ